MGSRTVFFRVGMGFSVIRVASVLMFGLGSVILSFWRRFGPHVLGLLIFSAPKVIFSTPILPEVIFLTPSLCYFCRPPPILFF